MGTDHWFHQPGLPTRLQVRLDQETSLTVHDLATLCRKTAWSLRDRYRVVRDLLRAMRVYQTERGVHRAEAADWAAGNERLLTRLRTATARYERAEQRAAATHTAWQQVVEQWGPVRVWHARRRWHVSAGGAHAVAHAELGDAIQALAEQIPLPSSDAD